MNIFPPTGKVRCLLCEMSIIVAQEHDFDVCACYNKTYIYWRANPFQYIQYGGKNRAAVVLIRVPYDTETMENLEAKFL